jgi:hypothetical protein
MTEKKKRASVLYHPSHIKIVAYLGEKTDNGATDEEIAAAIGCHPRSVQNWKKKYPEFAEACLESKRRKNDIVESSLYRRARGYTWTEKRVITNPDGSKRKESIEREVPPDTTACIFWLKNRAPDNWKDVNRQEHSGPDGAAIAVKILKGVSMDDL